MSFEDFGQKTFIGVGMFFRLILVLTANNQVEQSFKIWRCGFLKKEHLQKQKWCR